MTLDKAREWYHVGLPIVLVVGAVLTQRFHRYLPHWFETPIMALLLLWFLSMAIHGGGDTDG